MKKLYIGNLPWEVTEPELEAHFKEAGKVVSAIIILDRDTNRSKGFGFVEMETEAESKKAIEMFNDTEFRGRKIIVNEARPRPERRFEER